MGQPLRHLIARYATGKVNCILQAKLIDQSLQTRFIIGMAASDQSEINSTG